MYTKKQFGSELSAMIEKEINYNQIAEWAFNIYKDHGLEFETGLDYFALKLIAMQEGPEFILSKEELMILAKDLLGAGGSD